MDSKADVGVPFVAYIFGEDHPCNIVEIFLVNCY